MSGRYFLKSEGTARLGMEEWNKISGKKTVLYHCAESLPYDASVNRYLGIVKDTIEYELSGEGSSLELSPAAIEKEEPALKIIDKEQEGYSLTFQKWQGIVKNISKETFVAQLTDLLLDVPEEQAEFFRSDIQDDDKELLSEGAVFYWCIGYLISPSNQIRRTSFLRFQRLPLYSQESIEITARKVKDVQNGISWL